LVKSSCIVRAAGQAQSNETLSIDAHRDDGKRFIVRADEMLTAFVELQKAIHAFAVSLIL